MHLIYDGYVFLLGVSLTRDIMLGWVPIVPEKLTLNLSQLTDLCGVVPAIVDRWHHLVLLSLKVLCHTQTESSVHQVK